MTARHLIHYFQRNCNQLMRDGLKVDTIRLLAISNGIAVGKHTNGQGYEATTNNKTSQASFPLFNPFPLAGEEANESLCEFNVNADLVKLTRSNEGNFDCFASTYAGVCDQEGCLWRNTCFSAAQQGV